MSLILIRTMASKSGMVYAIPVTWLAMQQRRHATRPTWNLAHKFLANVQVGFNSQRSGVHGAHALEFFVATRVQLLVHGRISVDEQLHFGLDLAGNVGDTLDLEAQTAVVGGKGDVEEGGREAGVGHARVERARLDDALSGDERHGSGGQP